jgi:hypothetical protein
MPAFFIASEPGPLAAPSIFVALKSFQELPPRSLMTGKSYTFSGLLRLHRNSTWIGKALAHNNLSDSRITGVHPGLGPRNCEWNGKGSPAAFVASLNLHRRHLSTSQRSMIAGRLKELFEAPCGLSLLARRPLPWSGFLLSGLLPAGCRCITRTLIMPR